MTIEERLDRMEQLHAEQMEMSRQDRAAHITWKRDLEHQVSATWMAIDRMAKETTRMAKENEKGFAEMRSEFKERDRLLDERIHKLVSAIGDLIRHRDGEKNGEA